MTNLPPTPIEALHYVHHPNGVDEFIVNIPSREALHAWITQIEAITVATPPDGTIRELLDLRKGMTGISQSLDQVRGLLSRNSERRKHRLAVIHVGSLIPQLLSAVIPLLRIHATLKVKFFKPEQREQAITWLLADD